MRDDYRIVSSKELSNGDTSITLSQYLRPGYERLVTINIPFDKLHKPGEFVNPTGPFGLNLVFGHGEHYE